MLSSFLTPRWSSGLVIMEGLGPPGSGPVLVQSRCREFITQPTVPGEHPTGNETRDGDKGDAKPAPNRDLD